MSTRLTARVIRSTTSISLYQSRTFLISPIHRLKEDANYSPDQIERKKQEQLSKQKKGEGHWHEDLASSGEANVKADQQKVKDHGSHIEKLQKETESDAQKGNL